MINRVTALLVKELRLRTGVGFIACKTALLEENGDIEASVDNLRKKGKFKAEKKMNNLTHHGVIFSEIRDNIGVLLELNCETDFVAQDPLFQEFGNEIISTVFEKHIKEIGEIKNIFEDQKNNLIAQIDENVKIKNLSVLKSDRIVAYVHGFRIGVLVTSNNLKKELLKNISMHIAASKPEYLYPEDISDEIIQREYKIQLELSKKMNKSSSILKKIVDGRMKKFVDSISLIGQDFILDPSQKVGDVLKKHNSEITSFVRFEIGNHVISSKSIS